MPFTRKAPPRLSASFSALGVWSFSIGTSIGWGSFIVTCSNYLQKAGILGTVFGLLAGMAVVLVIAWNLQYTVRETQDAGGIYTFQKNTSGNDYGFLTGWFILMGYMAVLWANITSLPLFARYFLGDLFRFGFHYSIFDYEVYFGEALLCICALLLIGLLCSRSLRLPQGIMIVSVIVFIAGFVFCAAAAIINHGGSGFSFAPSYASSGLPLQEIVRIASISPWAFIGFENVTHFSEEYTFPAKRVRGILISSVIVTTLLYVIVSLLSISAYPPEYSSWLDYIRDMSNLEGTKAVPAFYAAEYYLGETGVTILLLALFCVILTSLTGNLMALSRLLFAAGRDSEAPRIFGTLNSKGIPGKAVWAVVAISCLIPFLGRTAIGWIVDVTALTASIIYALSSLAVFRHARKRKRKTEEVTGIVGFVLMVGFVLLLLLPNFMYSDAMATESYFLFAIWALLGLAYFRWMINRDPHHRYGKSLVVWLILLLLILFSSMMWASRENQSATDESAELIYQYHQTHHDTLAVGDDTDFKALLNEQSGIIREKNTAFSMIAFGMFILSMIIMVNNFKITRDLNLRLNESEKEAMTDGLTHVKNRMSYTRYEHDYNDRIQNGSLDAFGLAVFDINDLKVVNDSRGHEAGDEYILRVCQLICRVFNHSPVFRIGGDEFVALLSGDDYLNREALMAHIERASLGDDSASARKMFSIGFSEFIPGTDHSVSDVFTRADRIMYLQKQEYKATAKK